MIKFIDLFTGTGAFSIVLKELNFECVFSNDILKSSEQIYNANHDTKLTLKDINEINADDIPEHNLLVGGFPCQPFSIAGNQLGFRDPRSNVFWKIIEIVEKHKPDCIILENVKNLTTHDKGNTFRVIKESFNNLGYNIITKVLDTSKITEIPQHRERIFIVCTIAENSPEILNFPLVKNKKIEDFLEENVDDKYYYRDTSKIYTRLSDAILKDGVFYQYRRGLIRENKSNVCPTLTANMGTGGHNVPIIKTSLGIRKLSPRECFNLQGFPHTYDLSNISDCRLYSLAGNAVSIPVIKLIIQKIFFKGPSNTNLQ